MGNAVPPAKGLNDAKLSKLERRIVSSLADAFPRGVTKDRLISDLWFDDPNGGPDTAGNMVSVVVSRLRPKLEQHGWTIPRQKSGQASAKHYKLEAM